MAARLAHYGSHACDPAARSLDNVAGRDGRAADEVKALPQTFGDGGNWVMTEQTPRSPRQPQPRGQIPSSTYSSTRGVDFERMFVPDEGCIRRRVA